MKTIPELLSGQFDEELRMLVVEARGWEDIYRGSRKGTRTEHGNTLWGTKDGPSGVREFLVLPPFSTSLDACRELLSDLTEEEWVRMSLAVFETFKDESKLSTITKFLLRATARQICVAYLIVKGVLK